MTQLGKYIATLSGLISCLMQFHIGFLMMWRREGGGERTRWLLRETNIS
jgi:hypothetical protein